MTLCENIFTARQSQSVRDVASSHKIDNFTKVSEIFNVRGHQNCMNGVKLMAILLHRLFLPIVGAASGRVCAYSLRITLVQADVVLIRGFDPNLYG